MAEWWERPDGWRFERPVRSDYAHYCGECAKFVIQHVAGCAHIGTCPEFRSRDAYHQACPFFYSAKRRGR